MALLNEVADLRILNIQPQSTIISIFDFWKYLQEMVKNDFLSFKFRLFLKKHHSWLQKRALNELKIIFRLFNY